MTKKLIESYRSKKEEIEELHSRIQRLYNGDSMIGNNTILDYRKGYPVPQAVVGVDRKRVERMKSRYYDRIRILEEECQDVEDFIEDISDSLTRRIFRMYYVEGLSQKDIAIKINMDRSRISRKISDFLKYIQSQD